MSIQEYFADKVVLVTGATGLVGRVLVEKLLHDLPDIRRLYILIRPRTTRSGTVITAEARLQQEVLASSAFDRLRALHGGSFSTQMRDKVVLVEGDLSKEHLGLDEPTRRRLQQEVQVIINCAAVVSFDASIETALELNTLGPPRILEFARECSTPFFAHVSTSYVNGTRQGVVSEEPLDPTQAMVQRNGASRGPYDVDEEVAAIKGRVRQVEERSHGFWHRLGYAFSAWRQRNGRSTTSDREGAPLKERLRQEWVIQRLVAEGMRWARRRGWNDTYTFSKAMGEQMLVRHGGDIPTLIFRPSIIESAWETPAPGWLDGLRMLDPLIIAYGRKQLLDFPGKPDALVDMVPVDMVVNALLAAIPQAHKQGGLSVYQVATGMENPLTARKFCDLVREYFQREPLSGRASTSGELPRLGFPSTKRFLRRLRYRYMLPLRLTEALGLLGFLTPWGRRLRSTSRARRARVERLVYWARIYSPYSNALCRYETKQMRELLEALSPEERQRFNFDMTSIDWRRYIQEIHIPGVKRFLLGMGPRAEPGPGEERRVGTGRRPHLLPEIPDEEEVKRWLGARWLQLPFRMTTRVIASLVFRYYLGLRGEGLEKIPKSGPFIVVSNHSSHLDTGALMLLLGRHIPNLHPVAATDYFFRDRLWRWASRALIDAVPFDRQGHTTESLGLAIALLRQDHSLIYFPEGGRSTTGEMQPFKSGIGLLALESGAPVIPANVSGTYEALPKGSSFPKHHPIRVRFGVPISMKPYLQSRGNEGTQELARRITEDVQKAVEALR